MFSSVQSLEPAANQLLGRARALSQRGHAVTIYFTDGVVADRWGPKLAALCAAGVEVLGDPRTLGGELSKAAPVIRPEPIEGLVARLLAPGVSALWC